MNYFKTENGKEFLKQNDKVWMALDLMASMLEDLSEDMRSDYDDKVSEDEKFEDSEKGEEMLEKIEDVVDMRDKIEEYKDEVNDYVLYDNNAFNDYE